MRQDYFNFIKKGLIFLLFSFTGHLFGQDITIEQVQTNTSTGTITLTDTCPNSSYELRVDLKNNLGVSLGTSTATLRITVTGTNSGTYIVDFPSVVVASGVSTSVTTVLDLINPGPNTINIEVYFDASPATIEDSRVANIQVDPRAITAPITLLPTTTNEQQIVEIELGNVGSTTGATTETFTITLDGVAFTETVTASTNQSVAQVATALASLINANANYSASNTGVPVYDPLKNVIRIAGAVAGTSYSYSATQSSTNLVFGTPKVIQGSKSIEICSDESVAFNSSGGAVTSGYEFFVNGISISGGSPQNSNSYNYLNPSNLDVVRVEVTDSNGCVSESESISVNVNLTPEDSGSPIDVRSSEITKSAAIQSYTVSITGTVDTGDTYTITLDGTSYTSTNTVNTIPGVLADLDSQIPGSFDTSIVGSSITINSQVAGTYFSLTTLSDDADNGATIGSTMNSANWNLNVCDSDVQTLIGQNAASYRFYVAGSLLTNDAGTEDRVTLNNYLGNNNLVHIVGYSSAGYLGCSSDLYLTVKVNEISDAGTISSNQTICTGSAPSILTGTAASAPASATLSYYWEVSDGSNGYNSITPSVTTASFTPPILTQSRFYRRVARSDLNGKICIAYSNEVYINVEPAQAITLVSSSTLTTQDVCVGGAIEDIVYELSGSATTISPTSITAIDLPAGLTVDTTSKTAQTQVVTITGVATGTYIVAINGETYSYSATGTDTTSTIGAGLRTAINAGTSLVGVGGSASGITLTANVAGTAFDTRVGGSVGGSNMTTAITQANVNRVIIRGTVSAVATQTAYNYTLTTTGGVSCTTTASLGGTITVQASSTLALSSAVGTDAQVLCNNTPITDITYTVGGAATGASVVAPTAVVDGLPNGVTGSYLAGVFTITGTPSVTLTSKKVFTYSVVTTGNSGGCEEAEITGTITVQPAAEATVPSGQVSATSFTIFGTGTVANGSLDQTLCTGENLDGIRINLSGSAYTASIANLPPGMNFDAVQERQAEVLEVTASTASGTAIIYIDGVAYSYTNSTTEAVAVIAAQLTSEINSAVGARATSVVATNTGAQITLRQTTAGVPFTASTSVTAAFTITQSVTQPNINFYRLYGQSNAVTRTTSYPYVITTNGAGTNCNATTVNGTITLLADTTLTNISGASNQVICNGTFIEDIVLTMNGATAVSQLGLPPGVNVNVVDSIQEDTITLTGDSGAVTETYSISLTRGLATTTIYSVVSTAVTSATSLATSLTLEINNGENPNIIATASGTVITISGAASGTLFSMRVLSSPTTSMVTANITGNKQVTITGQVSTTLSGPTNYPFTITTTGDNCNPTTYSGTFEVAPLEGGIINGGVEQVLCDLSSSNILTVTGDNPNPRSGVEYTYQWQESTDGVNFTDVPANGQGATYDTQNSALTTTSYFRRNYTYTNGATSCTEASSIHKITLNNLTPGTIGPPNQVVAFGGNPSQIGSTLEATGEGDISYQWQMAYDLNPASNQPAPTYSGWIDITGEEDHAHPDQFAAMDMAELVTYGFIFSKDNKTVKTFSTYDVEDEYFSGRNIFPRGCIKKLEKIYV